LQEFDHEFAYHWFHFPTPFEKASGLWVVRSGCNKTKEHFKVGPRIISYYSLHFVLTGEGTIIQDNRKLQLKDGDIFCLFPNQTHLFMTDPQSPLELFWLALDGKQTVSILNRLNLTAYSFILNNMINREIKDVLDELKNHFIENIQDEEFKRSSIIHKLLHYISLQVKEKKLQPTTTNNWIQRSKQYMDMHFTEELSVADVAKYIGIHRSHFTPSFVNEFGITPVQYLLSLKMKRAAEMISEHSFTITEIAYSLGYSDLYSFSRAFKKFYGVSPKQYVSE
jgi:AraC-like DNA-binding protein